MKNAPILEKIHATVNGWQQQFDHAPDVSLTFSIDAGKLRLNNVELCDVSEIDLERISFDVEHLTVGPVKLCIEWPFAGSVRLFACREIPA